MKRLLWLALILLPVSAHAVIGFVRCANGTSTATTAVTATITATTLGDALVIMTEERTLNTTTWTMTTSAGQTPTQSSAGYVNNSDNTARMDVRYILNAASTTTVTATFSGTVNTNTMIVCEFSGVATVSAEESSISSNSGSFVTALPSGTYSTTNAGDVGIYAVGTDSSSTSMTAGSGYTIDTNAVNVGARASLQYQIFTTLQTTQTTTMTWTGGNRCNGQFIALKPAVAVTVIPRRPVMIL